MNTLNLLFLHYVSSIVTMDNNMNFVVCFENNIVTKISNIWCEDVRFGRGKSQYSLGTELPSHRALQSLQKLPNITNCTATQIEQKHVLWMIAYCGGCKLGITDVLWAEKHNLIDNLPIEWRTDSNKFDSHYVSNSYYTEPITHIITFFICINIFE